jgi:hypothetical protein
MPEKLSMSEDAVKKIGSRLTFVVLGILSFFGITPASATNVPQQLPKQINEVTNTTPLYLQLGIDMPKINKEKDITVAQHWNHWSHRDHRSHWAHYAHRAHYSHYDSWR